MGITKYMIIGAVAFVLAPMPPEAETSGNTTSLASIQTHELVAGAINTFTDVSSFCERQPQTCLTLNTLTDIAEAKAKYSIRLAYEWANGASQADEQTDIQLKGTLGISDMQDLIEHNRQPTVQPVADEISFLVPSLDAADMLVTGSTIKVAGSDQGTNTLKIEDILPDWRGPATIQQG